MVTSLLSKPVGSGTAGQRVQQLASEFRLLGLRPREARLDVIRGAVRETAGDLKTLAGNHGDGGDIARVAVAGYRLLDPRRRGTLFERVQLLLWNEEEAPASPAPLWQSRTESASEEGSGSSKNHAVPQIVALPVGNPVPPPVVRRDSDGWTIVERPDETQVALELFRALRSRHRRAMALWVSIAGLAASLLLTAVLVASLV